jgi:alkanesulfonate monooxygenase SsuD/methylene tetrahydromethanopterin reductase-like flavin-dependent oxidoreductase (luciferase family)
MLLILSENWTLTAGRDLPALQTWAREAEDAGFDAVMISEHVVLGAALRAAGRSPAELELIGGTRGLPRRPLLRRPRPGHGVHP